MTTYIQAISIEELPNRTVKTVQIRGKKIAVIRLDDRFRAVDALCTHMGLPLEKGEIDGDELVCPYHKARFCTNTGSKTAGPGVCDLWRVRCPC
jgi:3-phenylpropionate/trans-cinnamate dioxygenase ferredoxin subunit